MTGDGDKAGKPGKPGEDEAGFAGRWSRMKRAAKAAEPEGAPAQAAEAAPAAEDTRPDAEVLAELGLPDPDTLAPGDNFAAFMAKAVPARLRNRALRRLWLSNPVLANVDGLVDYGGDYTDAATVVENLQTAYQVGRGFVDRVAEIAKAEDEEAPDEAASGQLEAAQDAAPEPEEAAPAGEPEEAPEAAESPGGDAGPPPRPEPAPAPRRRMHFRLAED